MMFRWLALFPFVTLLIYDDFDAPPQFSNPLRYEQVLSATFGEPRTATFHSGIDIKVRGRIGDSVFSIADGFVSRIFVSPFGFGKALYIDHPTGYTSVYAHLDKFSKEVADYVRDYQYANKTFAVDIQVPANRFPVRKSECIGFAGNSGTSFGPHLHFEIRRTANQVPIDPLIFGFDIADNIPPDIKNIVIYPQAQLKYFNGNHRKQYPVMQNGNKNRLIQGDTILTSGTIGIGVHVTDRVTGSSHICGITRLTMSVNSTVVYDFVMDKLPFSDVRYVLSHTDYLLQLKNKQTIHKCFVEPGNQLKNYRQLVNRGLINLVAGEIYRIDITAADSRANQSKLTFYIRGTKSDSIPITVPEYKARWIPNQPNYYSDSILSITAPADALYDTLYFNYTIKNNGNSKFVSRIYSFGNKNTPLHRPLEICFKAETIKPEWHSKLVLINAADKNLSVHDANPRVQNKQIIATTRNFGDMAFMVDTTPPQILPLNVANGASIARKKSIRIKIVDNLSGINTYSGQINKKWVLFEYDAKNNLLEYFIDEHLPEEPRYELEIVVTDKAGNRATRKINLTAPQNP